MRAHAKLKHGKKVLANAVVQASSLEQTHKVNVKTDDDGVFTFENCVPGLYELRIAHDNRSYTAKSSLFRGGDQHLIKCEPLS